MTTRTSRLAIVVALLRAPLWSGALRISIAGLVVWLAGTLTVGIADQPPAHPETPELLAELYIDACSRSDWRRVAELSHPDEMNELRRLWVTVSKADKTGEVANEMFSVADGQAVEALPPIDVYAVAVEAFAKSVGVFGPERLVSSYDLRVLGSVPEGELVHVVYETNVLLGDVPFREVDTLTCKRFGGGWLALSDDSTAAIVSKALAQIPEEGFDAE